MLIYHPAFDAYHTAFRMLAITESIPKLEIDKARLLDFYLLFPATVSTIRLPIEHKGVRKEAKVFINTFHDPLDPKITFRDMSYIQEVSLKSIAAAGLIDIDGIADGFIVRTSMQLSGDLRLRLKEFIEYRNPVSRFVLTTLSAIALRGVDGLKDRTGLMEYRYDVN